MKNKIMWTDIRVKEFERARKFYSMIFGYDLITEEYQNIKFAPFHNEDMSKEKTGHKVSGCIVEDSRHQPSNGNPLLYLNAQGRIDEVISKIEEFGGKILEPKEEIGEWGSRAIIEDSEGNIIALHSF